MQISIPVHTLAVAKEMRGTLRVIAGEAALKKRFIPKSSVNRPGLLLAGYKKFFHHERIQIFGKTEIEYLRDLSKTKAKKSLDTFFSFPVSCVIITCGSNPDDYMLTLADKNGVPVFVTEYETERFITKLQDFLEEKIAPMTSIHGVLVDMFGVGVLIQGKSGIGKSETALELIQRGHRLVADDIVDIKRLPGPRLVGEGSEIIRHHMEVRGLGIINIKQIFGVGAVREKKKIELLVMLEEWKNTKEYDRLGLDDLHDTILEVETPKILIPVRPGRNLAVIVEVGAMNQRLKSLGFHSAVEFNKRLLDWIQNDQKGNSL